VRSCKAIIFVKYYRSNVGSFSAIFLLEGLGEGDG